MESLYYHNNYEIQETDKESVINLANRYKDIEKFFPDMEEDIIPVFIEWLKERVTFVESVTSTEQDAHKVFVAMNDRGLRLSPVEDRQSTRLNSSHVAISYAVFCLKKE